MKLTTAAIFFMSSLGLAATNNPQCKVGSPMTTGKMLTNVQIFKNSALCSNSGGSVDCTARLLVTQSTPGSTCPTSNAQHLWPLDSPSNCHGWAATDYNGKVHYNSANNIRCSADGLTMLYNQYPGVLDCSGNANAKTYVLNECHQGRPPMLWDKGVDFSCCSPDSSSLDVSYIGIETTPTIDPVAGKELCCSDGSLPIEDGDHSTPPCLDGSLPSAEACNSAHGTTTVTVTTYMDAKCTQTPSWKNSTFTMDITKSCNVLPDSSTSHLKCHGDYITYVNYPNSDDCSTTPIQNTLQVGVCQEFPGPVRTWKKVERPYNCRSNVDSTTSTPSSKTGKLSHVSKFSGAGSTKSGSKYSAPKTNQSQGSKFTGAMNLKSSVSKSGGSKIGSKIGSKTQGSKFFVSKFSGSQTSKSQSSQPHRFKSKFTGTESHMNSKKGRDASSNVGQTVKSRLNTKVFAGNKRNTNADMATRFSRRG